MLRRVCIECEDTCTATVTTYLQQKQVDLTKMFVEDKVLDLVSLRYLPIDESRCTEFYLRVDTSELAGRLGTMKNPYVIIVCARTGKDSWGETIGYFKIGSDKSKVFSVNIP